jgi:polyprenyldihydroxybenzoate methyltransferase/3-demethylubiquinol 3-O-methyltransferase
MARLGGDVTGIDPSTNLISVAQGKLNQENSQATSDIKLQAQFISTTIEEHAIKNQNIYDAVVLSEVIEHVSNKEDFLKATVDTLKVTKF